MEPAPPSPVLMDADFVRELDEVLFPPEVLKSWEEKLLRQARRLEWELLTLQFPAKKKRRLLYVPSLPPPPPPPPPSKP